MSVQTSMNVPTTHTAAIQMQHAKIPSEASHVHVTQDTMEME